MQRYHRRAHTALALAAITPVLALAEAPVLEELTVTASRVNKSIKAIPNTVKVIDREALDNQLAVSSSLLDGLSFAVPALTPAHQKMSSNGVTLRGRNPLYMTDGIPQSTPLRNGQRSAFTIDPAFIDRVEVIYGANAIQGVGATGGVINYVTTEAPDSGDWLRRASVELASDSFESDGFHYKASGLVGKSFQSTDFILGATYQVQDLFYDANGDPIAPDRVNVYAEGTFASALRGRLQYSMLLDRDFDGGLAQHDFDGYQLLDAVATRSH
ncbi:TonB-dependent receptor plug domain-containing protein [Parahaliea mediterranea]|uniref:TonB-dependent receptor plug domain-containing protein n=1 Tax=Parahaliea mediterranea TaxID=651086 RepID=UPI000E2F49BF|nr:TonB-dependent receptor plug domain-containing protein [Parahaliea mediterranea]